MTRFVLFLLMVSTAYALFYDCPPSTFEEDQCFYRGGLTPITRLDKACRARYREAFESAVECYHRLLRKCGGLKEFLRATDLTDLLCQHQPVNNLNCVFYELEYVDNCTGLSADSRLAQPTTISPAVSRQKNNDCVVSNKLHHCAKELKAICTDLATKTVTAFYDKRAPPQCPYSTSDGNHVFVTSGVMWLLVAMVISGQTLMHSQW